MSSLRIVIHQLPGRAITRDDYAVLLAGESIDAYVERVHIIDLPARYDAEVVFNDGGAETFRDVNVEVVCEGAGA